MIGQEIASIILTYACPKRHRIIHKNTWSLEIPLKRQIRLLTTVRWAHRQLQEAEGNADFQTHVLVCTST